MDKLFACASSEVDVTHVPAQIKILPLGLVKSQKGDFMVDEESFGLMKQHFVNRQLDLVVDYEHQTLTGTQAPAGGWIKSLSLGADAILADVSWTKRAKEYLQNKEYRYLSPVVMVRKVDNKAVALQSVALTNTPAIDGMFAIVNSLAGGLTEEVEQTETAQQTAQQTGGSKMDLKKLIQLLGLPEDADEASIQSALEARLEKEDSKKEETMVANNTILSLLQLKEDAKTEEVVASILSLKTPALDTKLQLEALTAKMAKKEAEEIVSLALKEGKISASQKDWAMEYALKDQKGFERFASMATPVVPMGMTMYANTDKKTSSAIGEVDMVVLKNLGFGDEEINKMLTKKEDN